MFTTKFFTVAKTLSLLSQEAETLILSTTEKREVISANNSKSVVRPRENSLM